MTGSNPRGIGFSELMLLDESAFEVAVELIQAGEYDRVRAMLGLESAEA